MAFRGVFRSTRTTSSDPHLPPSFLPSQRAALEREAYIEENKLLNQTQFQELLELQTDEPDYGDVRICVSAAQEEMLSSW